MEPLSFEMENFIPTLEKEFPDILNEMFKHHSQWKPLKPKCKQIHTT